MGGGGWGGGRGEGWEGAGSRLPRPRAGLRSRCRSGSRTELVLLVTVRADSPVVEVQESAVVRRVDTLGGLAGFRVGAVRKVARQTLEASVVGVGHRVRPVHSYRGEAERVRGSVPSRCDVAGARNVALAVMRVLRSGV